MIERKSVGEVTTADIIQELRIEISKRKQVFPRWIAEGRITESYANHRIFCLESALHHFEEVERQTREQRSLF